MPGMVVFRRRWSVGSDDLIIPALFLIIFHFLWLLVISFHLCTSFSETFSTANNSSSSPLLDGKDYEDDDDEEFSSNNQTSSSTSINLVECSNEAYYYLVGIFVDWLIALIVEIAIVVVSMRGSVLDDVPRQATEHLLYFKLVLWIFEIGLTIMSCTWLGKYYLKCFKGSPSQNNLMLSLVISNCVIFMTALITMWCSWDQAGRSWVKLKKYQQSLKDQTSKNKFPYRRSGANSNRNWRHRKVRRAYEHSWDDRCQLLFCCVRTSKAKNRSSFSDIARLLSEFFRDLDVVPSDVVVGLVLLRKRQQLQRLRVIHQTNNPVFLFLSGVRVTPQTRFLDKKNPSDLEVLEDIHHFMSYAVGVYGWPMYLRKNTGLAICKLCSQLRCCCFPKSGLCFCSGSGRAQAQQAAALISCDESIIDDDNCCSCNFAAYTQMCGHHTSTQIVFITYHVDVGETPFLIAVDYKKKAIVISIRGTLSLKDVLTDLNAEGEPLPGRPINEEWIGHKGMVNTATYIYKKLKKDHLLTKAFNWNGPETGNFSIVCVGHSLGAGTAAILSIMLKQEFPNTKCFSFSPPGGLLSRAAMEYSMDFIISVIVGKDVVPRVGLHQLEALRHDLIYAIHKTNEPKYKTLASSLSCCGGGNEEWTETDIEAQLSPTSPGPPDATTVPSAASAINIHPLDSSINLSVHQPLYPPGRLVHLVRYHPGKATAKKMLSSKDKTTRGCSEGGVSKKGHKKKVQETYTYRAIWAENSDFNEVLVSKRMVEDHMPDNVLDALNKFMSQSEEDERVDLFEAEAAEAAAAAAAIAASTTAVESNLEEPKMMMTDDGTKKVVFSKAAKKKKRRNLKPLKLQSGQNGKNGVVINHRKEDEAEAAAIEAKASSSSSTSEESKEEEKIKCDKPQKRLQNAVEEVRPEKEEVEVVTRFLSISPLKEAAPLASPDSVSLISPVKLLQEDEDDEISSIKYY